MITFFQILTFTSCVCLGIFAHHANVECTSPRVVVQLTTTTTNPSSHREPGEE